MKIRIAFIGVILAIFASSALAQYTPVSKEMLTVAGTAIGFSASVITPGSSTAKVSLCVARLETAPIRYWSNGATPTSTEGILVNAGESIEVRGTPAVNNFRAIRTTGVSGTLAVECSRQ